jgi:predicted mannosyl-3-phosphoglycerate phosphatase (HAD superfamily)
MQEITIKRRLSDEFLSNVLHTAAEGGIGYLARARKAQVEKAASGDWIDDILLAYEVKPRTDEGQAFADGDSRNDWQHIDHAKIAQAIERILTEQLTNDTIREYISTAVLEDDSGNIDGEAADCIVQIAALGEIVFG